MFASNPYADLPAFVSPFAMQAFVVTMALLVAAGTIYDVLHKKSASYFFRNWKASREKGRRAVSGGELAGVALKTVAVDILTSGEFCNQRRRIAHLLTMYGFLLYVITTAIIAFRFPAGPAPAAISQLWHTGAVMICIGGYWFWFFIRVDVAAEGHSPFRIVRADLFILSLLESATCALLWSWLQYAGSDFALLFFALHVVATTILFASVPWSKFSHMFFKPAAAFEKRVSEANGSRSNLPPPADKPATFGTVGQQPQNY